ncbi:MAG: cupredoxin domain-containing protein [Chloroflexi bacterium]|nr:cupredoxin domain-containing protein [Chloroflexota bacterium]
MKRLALTMLLVESAFLVVACSSRIPGYPSDNSPLSYYQQEVQLQAKQCQFSTNRIEVQAGKPVKLTVTSDDVYHGVSVDGLDIGSPKAQGRTEVYSFTPLGEGEYRFSCNVACGCGHIGDMYGTLIVTNSGGSGAS